MAHRQPQAIEVGPVVWTGLWIALMAVALYARPFMPIDETRYLAVAWEMWQRGDFLVPHLNGEPYSHKPPLLFWLIHAGWVVFGVNDRWSRLVAPLFGLGSLFLTAGLARRLWPERPGIDRLAPMLLLGGAFWALFTTLTMFDMMVGFFALLGLIGVLDAWRGRFWRGFTVLGIAIGLGVLAKGPAILIHTLPAALFAPLWGPHLGAKAKRPGWGRWYAATLGAVLLGSAIGLAWAIPAAKAGGPAYSDAIFWGQSAGRVVESFAHRRPFWWYVVALPVMLMPWVAWPPLWRAWRHPKAFLASGAGRFCAIWILPAFVLFSAISGKQPHYLLPELPGLALAFAALLTGPASPVRRAWDLLPPILFFALIGVAVLLVPVLPIRLPEPDGWMHPAWGLLPLAAAALAWWWGRASLSRSVAAIAGMTAVAVVTAHLVAHPLLAEAHDLTTVSRRLGALQAAGHPLANYGKYHGQYQFLGRLAAPIDVIEDADVPAWTAAHPDGLIIAYYRERPVSLAPRMVFRFRGKWLAVWTAATAGRDPSILHRK